MTEFANGPSAVGVAKNRRRWPWVVAATAVGVAGFALFWFQPHKLFIDDRVDEAVPTVPRTSSTPSRPASGPTVSPPAGTPEPLELARGDFVSLDHGTRGRLRVLELDDGSRYVRLEGLDTSNGPDLYVYLSTNPVDGDEGAFDDRVVNLGRLKGNQGDQNYTLPAGADLAAFESVVIWCDRFDSAFGAAELSAA